MKLTVTLSPTEQANIHGWVNLGKADPAFADHPYRIVLSERTRARYDEVAAQFDAPVPVIAYHFGAIDTARGRTDWVLIPPGAIFALIVPPGRVSANVDDGASRIWVSVNPNFTGPFLEQTVNAAGNSTWLTVPGGAVYGKYEGTQARQVRWDWSPAAP